MNWAFLPFLVVECHLSIANTGIVVDARGYLEEVGEDCATPKSIVSNSYDRRNISFPCRHRLDPAVSTVIWELHIVILWVSRYQFMNDNIFAPRYSKSSCHMGEQKVRTLFPKTGMHARALLT
jgi:hypothetical protein